MPIDRYLQAWRKFRGYSTSTLAEKTGIAPQNIEEVETGGVDPPTSLLEALSLGLGIPPAWLFYDPSSLKLLLGDPDDEEETWLNGNSQDPVIERILTASHQDRELFALLTALLQSQDPKLIRAAEVNLRSLLKQIRTTNVPWQSRPPGHFEPPSD